MGHQCRNSTRRPTAPVATAITLLSYVRERDTALEGIVDMHLFARSLAARDVTSGRSYVQEVWALLQTEPELTRAPVTAWAHHITATAADHTAILCINRALALFELLLRAMAPCVEQTDQLLMLLSGVQVHWLPMLHDRFLHPATLLAISGDGHRSRHHSCWAAKRQQQPAFVSPA